MSEDIWSKKKIVFRAEKSFSKTFSASFNVFRRNETLNKCSFYEGRKIQEGCCIVVVSAAIGVVFFVVVVVVFFH